MRQIQGRNPVIEALRAKKPIVKILIQESIEKDSRINEILDLANKNSIKIIKTKNLDNFSKERHQGIIAFAEEEKEKSIKNIIEKIYKKNKIPLVILVSDVEYEHNLGKILRSADCFQADAVIVSKNAFKITPVVSKSSAGASEHINLIHSNLFSAMKYLRKQGLKIIGLKQFSDKKIFNSNLKCPLAIVIGSEHKGINESLEKYIDEFVSIPIYGKIDSLNMATALSISLYEVIRQRNI
jgi:23S rRNA (guanosine2251-2'-O)-methyltransferase